MKYDAPHAFNAPAIIRQKHVKNINKTLNLLYVAVNISYFLFFGCYDDTMIVDQ
jgi:hypothetical protein